MAFYVTEAYKPNMGHKGKLTVLSKPYPSRRAADSAARRMTNQTPSKYIYFRHEPDD